jgi:zinc D-Ala-D-Ala dipeptidase
MNAVHRFDPLHPIWALRQKPIPDQDHLRVIRQGYRDHAIDADHSAGSEPLVDVRSLGILGTNIYWSDRSAPYYERIPGAIEGLWVRTGVGERLGAVNTALSEIGIALYVHDAWRPRAIQAHFHDVWTPQQIRARRPDLTDEEVARETLTYWAAPTQGEGPPAPHATGAAMDLSLVWKEDGRPLWMGSLMDEVSPLAWRDHFERQGVGQMSFSNEEARANRRLLHWVMAEQGLVGLPDEWWHFSYGDQMWARLNGAKSAIYGIAAPPSDLS